MLEKIKTKNLTFAGLWVLFTAALALWAEILCREDSLSHDTFYQLNLIMHPWNELLYYISIDYSPPLFAFVLKILCLRIRIRTCGTSRVLYCDPVCGIAVYIFSVQKTDGEDELCCRRMYVHFIGLSFLFQC